MKIIPITTETPLDGEHYALTILFEKYGVERLHVRKPSFSLNEMRQWIAALPSEYHPCLRLHDHFELTDEFALGGLHLNARNPLPPVGYNGKLSASCHSLQQAKEYLQVAAPTTTPITTPTTITTATPQPAATITPTVTSSTTTIHQPNATPTTTPITTPTATTTATPKPALNDIFLSPIFNSISKVGYKSNFPEQELAEQMRNIPPDYKIRIIALGGITPQNIAQLQHLGFGGVAVIGSLWKRYAESKNIKHLLSDYAALKDAANAADRNIAPTTTLFPNSYSPPSASSTTIHHQIHITTDNQQSPITFSCRQSDTISILPKVMFITHATEKYNYIQSAEIALKGGIKWIQYRHKPPVTYQQQQAEISAIAALCKQYGALLTINDHPALAINADGLHVGLQDITVAEARLTLGANKIIGGTANTFDHIKTHARQHADYVGVGPVRYTKTKKNLSPGLGLNGYADLVRRCRSENINIPIYAIGGIRTEDIKPLIAIGIYGIAISSLILQAENPVKTSRTIVDLISNTPLTID
jgi:thiamine-phosphate pyrophosphorylase